MTHQHPTGERMIPGVFDPVTVIEHLHRYALAIGYCKDRIVLDIACGEGYGSALLASHAAKVTGVDIDRKTIESASKRYRQANLDFKQGTADEIPLEDQTIDIVVSFETIEHHDKHEQMMAEIKRVLKPGGLLIISTPDKKNYSDIPGHKNPFHVKELYVAEFTSLLQKYFSQVQLFGQQAGLMSVIFPLDDKASPSSWSAGNASQLLVGQPPAPIYLVAIASDAVLPSSPTHFFRDKEFSENSYRQQLQTLIQSPTYKTGQLLLAPAKWIRSLFRRRN